MATIGSLVVNLIANTAGFSAGMQKGVKETKALETRMVSASKVAASFAGALGFAGVAVTAGNFLKGAIEEAADAEKVMKQLETVIRSTGGAAGFSAVEISVFASQLQNTTTFADDATKSAAALLATFTNIRGDVFKGAIVSAQDMSTALGQDLQTSVMQLGKALNDPIKGIGALMKVGVSFTEQQRNQIKTLVQNGEAMKAQRIILAELAKEFGGSAAAAIETTTGKIEQLKNEWADLKELVGENVALPAVNNLLRNIDFLGDKLSTAIDFSSGMALGIPMQQIEEFRAQLDKTAESAGNVGKELNRLSQTQILKHDAGMGLKASVTKLADGMAKDFVKKTKSTSTLSGLFDTAFSSLGVGKNRENLRGVSRSQFDAWSAARNPMTPMMRPEYRPLAALRRGSAEAYSALVSSKATPFTALNDTAKKQLVAQQQIATNTGKMATPNVIAMGN